MRPVVPVLLAAMALLACSAAAQEPILTFAAPSDPGSLSSNGTAVVEIEIRNDSIREADDIELYWSGTESVSLAEPFQTIKVLAPFSSTRATVTLLATGAAEGDLPGAFEVVYTYCIDDLCFQVVDMLDLTLRIEPAAVVDVPETPDDPVDPLVVEPLVGETSGGSIPWIWIASAVAMVCLGIALWLWRVRGDMWPVYLAFLLVIGLGLAYGVAQRQHEQARSIGSVLCLSCVGIEVASEAEPSFGASSIARIGAITEPIELWVFFAVWCKTCPFAEAMVELAASYNPDVLTYRFIDVEREPDLAVEHGIVDTGRTVVPAILRVDTGDVLFGTERLEDRLVELLEGEA